MCVIYLSVGGFVMYVQRFVISIILCQIALTYAQYSEIVYLLHSYCYLNKKIGQKNHPSSVHTCGESTVNNISKNVQANCGLNRNV